MTDNDIPRYDLELVRSSLTADATADVVQNQQPQVVYTQTDSFINPTVVVVFALFLGIITGLMIANVVNKHG